MTESTDRAPTAAAGGTSDLVLALEVDPSVELLSCLRLAVRSALEAEETMTDDRIRTLLVSVTELATNAIEAHRRLDRRDRVRLELHHRPHHRVTVLVEDNGGGIDPRVLDAIGKQAPLSTEHGLGLGLTVATSLSDVRFHGRPGGTAAEIVVDLS
ncbi:MAG: ATP-binding protein [Actinomycetota bacterium]|nr:ATP-binding protein [Actinomycetota bacterium]